MKRLSPLMTLLGLGLLLRLVLGLYYPISGDACGHTFVVQYLQFFKQPMWEVGGHPVWWPFFYHSVIAVIDAAFSLLGFTSLGLIIVNVFLGTASIWACYQITAHLTKNSTVSLLTAAIVALSPMHIFFSSVLYIDVPVFAFTMFFVYFLLKRQHILATIFGALAIVTKVTGLIVLLFLPIIFLLRKERFSLSWFAKMGGVGISSFLLGGFFILRPLFVDAPNPANGGVHRAAFSLFDLTLWSEQLYSFFGVPQGNLFAALSYLPIPSTLAIGLGIIWTIIATLYLLPLLPGLRYHAKKYWAVSAMFLLYAGTHVFMMRGLGPGDAEFRYSLGMLFPIAFFLSLGIVHWKKYFNKKRLLALASIALILFYLPLFVSGFIGHSLLDRWSPAFETIEQLPDDAFIIGKNHCIEVQTERIFMYLSNVDRERYLDPDPNTYLVITESEKKVFEDEGSWSTVQEEFTTLTSAHDLLVMQGR